MSENTPASAPIGSESLAPLPPTETPKHSGLATAALIVGIVAMVAAIVPVLSFVAFLPALAALVLGIIALVRRTSRRGRAITGLVLGGLALLVAIAVSIGTIVVAASSLTAPVQSPTPTAVPDDEPSPSPSATPQSEPEPTEEAAPVAPVVPADAVYSGTGDSILAIQLPDGAESLAIATIGHSGSSNFAIWSLDSGMTQQDLLINTIGNYQGTVLFNTELEATTTALEITADGPWTVTVRSLQTVREFAGNAASGTGDDVVIYRGEAGAATINHDGASNFTVWQYGEASDLAVNEIGVYTGTVRWAAGPGLVEVNADGNWNITVG